MKSIFTFYSVALFAVFVLPGDSNASGKELRKAVEENDVARFEVLLKNNPSDVYEDCDWTGVRANPSVIQLAVELKRYEMILLMVKYKININRSQAAYGTPLQSVSFRSDPQMAKFLLQNGATLDLFSAIGLDKRKEVKQYLDFARFLGIEKHLFQSAYLRRRPLNWAARFGRQELVALLLSRGANVNELPGSLSPPLHDAIEGGHLEIVKFLISQGADVDGLSEYGWSPIQRAAYLDLREITKYLLEKKAKVDSPLRERQAIINGDFAFKESRNTPLHLAAEQGNTDLIELLVAYGAKLDIKNADKQTPLELAQAKKQEKAVETLRRVGAK